MLDEVKRVKGLNFHFFSPDIRSFSGNRFVGLWYKCLFWGQDFFTQQKCILFTLAEHKLLGAIQLCFILTQGNGGTVLFLVLISHTVHFLGSFRETFWSFWAFWFNQNPTWLHHLAGASSVFLVARTVFAFDTSFGAFLTARSFSQIRLAGGRHCQGTFTFVRLIFRKPFGWGKLPPQTASKHFPNTSEANQPSVRYLATNREGLVGDYQTSLLPLTRQLFHWQFQSSWLGFSNSKYCCYSRLKSKLLKLRLLKLMFHSLLNGYWEWQLHQWPT